MISIILSEYKIGEDWILEYQFYYVDLKQVNLSEDIRFKEINGKRKKSILIGVVDDLEFPVKYPIKLEDGNIIYNL